MKTRKICTIVLAICVFAVLFTLGGYENTYAAMTADGETDENGLVIRDGKLINGQLAITVNGVLTIPEGVTVIGCGAFDEAWQIKKIILPSTIRTIEGNAFELCSYLREIELPEGLEHIGRNAFQYTSLKYIIAPDSLVTIEDGGLSNGILLDIYGKKGTAAEAYAKKHGNKFYSIEEYIIEGDVLKAYKGSSAVVEIPGRVTKIGDDAFAGNETVEQVLFHEGVTSIGEKAFQNCTALSSLELSDGLTNIGYAAFDGCDKLEKLTLPAGIQTLYTNIFAEAESFQMNTPGPDEVSFHPSHIKELVIENNRFTIFTEEEPTSQWGNPMAAWPECMTNLETVYGYYDCEAETLAGRTGSRFVPLDEEYTQLSVNYSNQLTYMEDVDENGVVNAEDALEILRYIVGMSDSVPSGSADMDGNGNVGAGDALVVLRCAVHLLETRAVKPVAYETYQFSVNGRFQGLTIRPEDVTREAMIAKDKTELCSYLETIYENYKTEHNEQEFDMMIRHFASLDEEYFKDNVCVVTVAAGALQAGTYSVCAFTNRDVMVDDILQKNRGLVMNYSLGTDENVIDDLDTYILVGGTTIPRGAFENGELSYVTFRNVSR